jgi:glycosyltransferase involved in cell wall biosynthesis
MIAIRIDTKSPKFLKHMLLLFYWNKFKLMSRPPVSVTIITLNEEENILRAMQSVSWAEEILVIDSGSTDRTVEIAQSAIIAANVRVIIHPWPGYGQQKNFAQSQATHDWVLNIDADEEVSPDLKQEIEKNLEQLQTTNSTTSDVQGFFFPRKTFYLGRWIKHGGWYPNHLVRLVNRKFAQWTEPQVHEELQVNGKVVGLKNPLHHFAFLSIHDQILTNLKFSRLGSEDLKKTGQQPSLQRLILKPVGKFFETYLIKGGFLDGLPGFIISINASHSMFLKYAYLSEEKIREKKSSENLNH